MKRFLKWDQMNPLQMKELHWERIFAADILISEEFISY